VCDVCDSGDSRQCCSSSEGPQTFVCVIWNRNVTLLTADNPAAAVRGQRLLFVLLYSNVTVCDVCDSGESRQCCSGSDGRQIVVFVLGFSNVIVCVVRQW
jgi:Tfp pilus assembly protein FimT